MTAEKDAMNAQVRAVRIELLAIAELSKKVPTFLSVNPVTEIRDLLENYSAVRKDFERIMANRNVDLHLRDIETSVKGRSFPTYNQLRNISKRIEIECQKGAGALDAITTSVPKTELDRLESLREELTALSTQLKDINYEKNVGQAIDEYEAGHTLASALISSRVIIYALDKIPGSVEEKVKFLDEKKVIDRKGKDTSEFILKANKKARDFFSHDIKALPDSSDAISLLGDTIAILRIVVKLQDL